MEHQRDDDELVYPPSLHFSEVPGQKSLVFEGLVQQMFCQFFIDCGATHSFVSLDFARENHLSFSPVSQTSATLADGTGVAICGVVHCMPVKFGAFRAKQDFLVVDIPRYDAVLGMDFLVRHDPLLSFKARTMTFSFASKQGQRTVTVEAVEADRPVHHSLQSDTFELCSFDALSKTIRRDVADSNMSDAFVACVVPTLQSVDAVTPTDPLLSGKGASHPSVSALLREYSDVLVTQIPGGLPPERVDAEGKPIEHTIEVDPQAEPFKRSPRPFTSEEDAELRRYLQDFLAKGWITPSLSPWAAPVLFVPKKVDPVTGKRTWRMCISYVKLNSKTLNRIAYRLPRISDLLERISGAQYFSKLDLLDGYYQVRMRSSDLQKTAFATPYGNYEFKVMPMGLCGAPSTFQYLMDNTFNCDFRLSDGTCLPSRKFLAIYLDDICIFSFSEQEHLMHVRSVLQRLREHKLYVKPSKCEWLQQSVEFLGHMVSSEGMSIHPQKAAALQVWPAPSCVQELRSALGTFGFWRSYVNDYAGITAPLHALLTKSVVWRWRKDVEQAAFDTLKSAVASAPVLLHPDTSKPFVIVSDASDFAVGASLEQTGDDGRRRPVSFFSHKLNTAERNYPVHERELLAIVLSLRVWRHLLYGSDFQVLCKTDHRPLQHFLTQANLSPRQVRWQQFLSEYNLAVEYVPGRDNTFADGLSRRPDLRLMLVSAVADVDHLLKEIKDGCRFNHEAKRLVGKARSATPSARTPYRLLHGLLYHVLHGKHRVFVPQYNNLRSRLIAAFHDLPVAGHLGWHKTYDALSQHYYWPGMTADVQEAIRQCPTCQRTKITLQPKPLLRPLPVPDRPFSTITLDWLSGFPMNKHGHDALLNIIDRFTKWAIVIPCTKTMNTQDLCDVLYKHVFSWVGLPEAIIGDRDTRLTASRMRSLSKALGLRVVNSTAYHPQTDGQTENFHRTLLSMMRAFVNKYHSNWEDILPSLLYAYHNTIHSATGYTPHRLLFGWTPRDLRVPMLSASAPRFPEIEVWLSQRQNDLRKAGVSLEAARAAMIRASKPSSNPHEYCVGDLVKVSTRVLPVRCSTTQVAKLLPRFIGPFEVTEIVAAGAIRLKLPDAYVSTHDVFSVHDLRPWLHAPERRIELEYPDVVAHPSLNRVIQVLDRKKFGRAPRGAEPLDIPARYLVVRVDGTTEWVPHNCLREDDERELVKKFEYRFPRSVALPCESVSAYPAADRIDDEDVESDDEVNVPLAVALEERFGPRGPL